MSQGVITAIKDLVVYVEMDEELPELNELLVVKNDKNTILLVDSLQPDNQIVCLNIRSDQTIQRGMVVERTGHSIEIAVGDKTIGRMFDALGAPIDGLPALEGADIQHR